MNVKLLRKVKKQILSHPSKLDMSTYIAGKGCGTTACIAGWACVLTGNAEPYNPRYKAAELLGISERKPINCFSTAIGQRGCTTDSTKPRQEKLAPKSPLNVSNISFQPKEPNNHALSRRSTPERIRGKRQPT